jgi:hypothetical protein
MHNFPLHNGANKRGHRQARAWRSGVDPDFLKGNLKRIVIVVVGMWWRFDYSYTYNVPDRKCRCKCKKSFTRRRRQEG